MIYHATKSCTNGSWGYVNITLPKNAKLNRVCFDINEFPIGQEFYIHLVYGKYTTFAYNLPIIYKKVIENDTAVGRAGIDFHENLNGIKISDGSLTVFFMQWVNLGAAKTCSITIDYEVE